MDVRIDAFALCRLGLDSALAIPAAPELKIIYVLTGTVHLSVEGSERQELPPGSIVLIPNNRAQVQAGSKGPEPRVREIGRVSGRETVYQDGWISGVAGS